METEITFEQYVAVVFLTAVVWRIGGLMVEVTYKTVVSLLTRKDENE